jgi:hypothetical protein
MIPQKWKPVFGKDHAQIKINDGSDSTQLGQTLVVEFPQEFSIPGPGTQLWRPTVSAPPADFKSRNRLRPIAEKFEIR